MTLKKLFGLWVLTAAVLLTAFPVGAQDWPQWRGPARDGVVPSFQVPESWPESLTPQWEIEVGLGYATPVLVDDHLYVFSRQGDDEIMMALDPPLRRHPLGNSLSGTVRCRRGCSAPREGAKGDTDLRRGATLHAGDERYRDRVRC